MACHQQSDRSPLRSADGDHDRGRDLFHIHIQHRELCWGWGSISGRILNHIHDHKDPMVEYSHLCDKA